MKALLTDQEIAWISEQLKSGALIAPETDSSRIAKKEGNSEKEKFGWNAVSTRFKFLRLFLNILSTLSNIDVADTGKVEIENSLRLVGQPLA